MKTATNIILIITFIFGIVLRFAIPAFFIKKTGIEKNLQNTVELIAPETENLKDSKENIDIENILKIAQNAMLDKQKEKNIEPVITNKNIFIPNKNNDIKADFPPLPELLKNGTKLETVIDLSLEVILQKDNIMYALISGQMVKIGQKIDNCIVKKIYNESVLLSCNGNEKKLTL